MTEVADLRAVFGDRLQENVLLAPYTSARIGGPADFLVMVKSAEELGAAASHLWEMKLPFVMLGGGSNVLVSERGVRGVVILNRAKEVRFMRGENPKVWVESGVIFSNLANRCAALGLGGLEWAATVPGTIGGAVHGNAGAFGGEVAGHLIYADLLTERGREQWPVEKLEYGYRTSSLKRGAARAVVLAAELSLKNATVEEVSVKIAQFSARRKATQPPGASMGSMFKNPPGDFAGRLIDAAGLKGTRIGNAEISAVHGNFFVNRGETRASDVRALIELAQKEVFETFGVHLELEVELIGEW
ncbi:MAG: UDP-N-acetylenolpyruvoylglucosamine reductase [Anaerolineales bacterium]|nr:UDP-N-acetylenolpyruvoylglucosamine reductase [Anaerolineales bacterium]